MFIVSITIVTYHSRSPYRNFDVYQKSNIDPVGSYSYYCISSKTPFQKLSQSGKSSSNQDPAIATFNIGCETAIQAKKLHFIN